MTANQLRELLSTHEDVVVLDVRPKEQREEWYIPGSIYIDAYEKLNNGDLSVLDEIQVPNNSKAVTVCAAGRISQIACDALRKKGIDAYSLEGGMKAWNLSWNTASLIVENSDIKIIQIRRTGKGCLSYLIASAGSAVIVDPSVEVEVYRKLLTENQYNLTHVLETHTHADHLSRARLLADEFGAILMLPNKSNVLFPFETVSDGQLIQINALSFEAISTPGHTYDSTSYLLNKKFLFTGDTLFTNSIGRPDLKSSEEETKAKATLLHKSLKHLLEMEESVIVLPGHMNKPAEFDGVMICTTIGEAKQNIQITKLALIPFVEEILKNIPPTPENYLHIVAANTTGELSLTTELEAGANRCAIN